MHEGADEDKDVATVVSTGTATERGRPILRGTATVNIEEISSVMGGSMTTSGHLVSSGGRKRTSEVQFTLGPASKVAKTDPEVRILGTEAATIPTDPTIEPTVTLFTTTSSTPRSAGAPLLMIAALASQPSTTPQQGGVRLSHRSDLPLSGSLVVTPQGGLVVTQTCPAKKESRSQPLASRKTPTSVTGTPLLMGDASRSTPGPGRLSVGGVVQQAPATSTKCSDGGKEEIVIDDDEEELEDVDDDEDDDLTPSQLLQRATSCTKWVGNEGEDEDYDPTGYKRSEMIRFLCNPLYFQDSDGAQEVWGRILGLDKGVKPTKRQINQSPLFKLKPPPPGEEKNPGIIVVDYWIDILTEEGTLGDCHPKDYHPPAGYGKLYTWDGLRTHCPSALSAWKDDQVPPSLILLVPALASGTRIGGDYGLSNFHEVEACLKKVTIGRGEKTRKQFGFCVYCGICHENQDTLYNHIRRHIDLEFLCEPCLSTVSTSPKQMATHMTKCKSADEVRPAKPGKSSKSSASHSTPASRTQPDRKGRRGR